MKNILVLGAGEYQVSGIKKLKEKGYRVIAVDGNAQAAAKDIADVFYNIDIKHAAKIIELVKSEEIEPCSCMCFATEIAVRQVAEINEYFSLVGIKTAMARLGTDKGRQRDIIREIGLPAPNYIVADREANVRELIKKNKLNYPLILKPVDNSGSRGVTYLAKENGLESHLEKCFNYSVYNAQVIIEEYIAGVEFTVESIVSKGRIETLAISEKKKPIGNYTVSTELFYNSPLVEALQKRIELSVNKFVSACGFDNTILHTEVIYSFIDEQIYIIESAVRSGGFNIFDKILPQITGRDIVGLTIDVNLEKAITLEVNNRRACVLRFFTGNQGKLRSINIQTDLIKPLTGIEYGFFVKPNDQVGALDTDGARLGYLISTANTWEEAYNKANIIDYAIKFLII